MTDDSRLTRALRSNRELLMSKQVCRYPETSYVSRPHMHQRGGFRIAFPHSPFAAAVRVKVSIWVVQFARFLGQFEAKEKERPRYGTGPVFYSSRRVWATARSREVRGQIVLQHPLSQGKCAESRITTPRKIFYNVTTTTQAVICIPRIWAIELLADSINIRGQWRQRLAIKPQFVLLNAGDFISESRADFTLVRNMSSNFLHHTNLMFPPRSPPSRNHPAPEPEFNYGTQHPMPKA
ncbi:hypothetical protein C8R44DRAFT_754612 [Mycena epipterygia]|nr:hypothetical protein C8R44DRAFT_754612 [Mycena epipterygia]